MFFLKLFRLFTSLLKYNIAHLGVLLFRKIKYIFVSFHNISLDSYAMISEKM